MEDLEPTVEVIGEVLLGVREEDKILPFAAADELFPEGNERRSDTRPLKKGVRCQGAGVPDALSGLLVVVTGLPGRGIHREPVIQATTAHPSVDKGPAVKEVAQVRGLPVPGSVELSRGGQSPVHPG